MVATRGVDWYLADSLIDLFEELDQRYPNRSKVSDGSIGDASHQARPSDHNPDWDSGGVVRAGDVTDDPVNGIGSWAFANYLMLKRDPRVQYIVVWHPDHQQDVIWNIDREFEGWRLKGTYDHRSHVHISIKHTTYAEMLNSPWLPPLPEEDDMPYSPDELKLIVAAGVESALESADGQRLVKKAARQALAEAVKDEDDKSVRQALKGIVKEALA